MSTSIEKYRVIVEMDGKRYVIARHLGIGEATYGKLTDRGPVSTTAEERAQLAAIAKMFDAVVGRAS